MSKTIDKYTYRVEWSEEDGIHISKCLEFPSLSGHGKSAESALKQIKIAVKASVDWLKEENEKIPEPFGLKKFKGNLTLRIPPEIHRQLAVKSAEERVSINQYILSKII